MLKHSCLINGYDKLNLTKLDVLDQLKEIQVAVGYEVDGKELEGFPGTSSFLHCTFSVYLDNKLVSPHNQPTLTFSPASPSNTSRYPAGNPQ